MKTGIVMPKGILRNVDNRLTVMLNHDLKAKKERHVTFHHDLENRVQEEQPVPETNQMARARKMLKELNGAKLFKQATAIEVDAFDYADLMTAFKLHRQASEYGNLDSTFRVGQILEEGLLVKRSIENLDIALEYFTKLKFELTHPKHDEAMDYIQSIYILMAKMYQQNDQFEEALECYEMVPHRTEDVYQNIIILSYELAEQLLAQDNPDLEKALRLLVDVSHMRPTDIELRDRIKKLKFDIGFESFVGPRVQQKLLVSYKYLEELYAEDPEYPDLRDLFAGVIKRGILPDGYKTKNSDNYLKVFAAVKYFLQFVFRKSDFQEINHDGFLRDLIMNSVVTFLSEKPQGSEKLDKKATKLWNFVLTSYYD